MNNNEKRLATRTPPTQLKKAAEVAQENSNNWLMVSFIDNGTEKTNCMGYTFKTKSAKSKAKFSR